MLYATKLRLNDGRLTKDSVVSNRKIKLSWALGGEGAQIGYFVSLHHRGNRIYESGWISSAEQSCEFTVPSLRSGYEYRLTLSLRDEKGNESISADNTFRVALLEEWDAPWIRPADDMGDAVIYFGRDLELESKRIENAVLYICGIGYHSASLNGQAISDHRLAPSFSDYQKRCYYETLDVSGLLREGKNRLGVCVAQGWRRNLGDYLKHTKDHNAAFFGTPQLTAILSISFEDGTEQRIVTDENWTCGGGRTVSSHLFDGEVFDARISSIPQLPCVICEKPSADTVMCPEILEPIRVKRIFEPASVYKVGDGYIFDLGQNIAGVPEITVPTGLPEGTRIVLQHAEMLDGDGDIYTAPLRGALATDTYIVGKENPSVWSPSFTYHGFRYVKVSGLPFRPSRDFLRGLQFYTDIDAKSSFRCGSAMINKLQEMIVMTERDNIHSIATDCPQRDERMGWLNDASVRFEEMPYNFDVGRLFPKIIGDIRDEQIDGTITCTAPYVFGNRPADPVSSSFLIAAYMSYMHYGNTDIIKDAYPAMCAWNDYLESVSEGGIIPVTYYGDWASPEDCCTGFAGSALTPGELMSTGYHYLNSKLLATFARIIGNSTDEHRHTERAELVKGAMLSKWVSDDGRVADGSQGSQALALRLGILPENMRERAAAIMNQAVIDAGMRLTTGNLTTLYLMEMLAEYGYIDTAYELITREEYPSWGYMMQNGGTTIWERFELKKDPSMNSHCHPMYGAVGKWLYTHIAGITPTEAGFARMTIRPYMPSKLLSAQATVDTCRGDVTVRWDRSYGEIHLLVDIPYGSEAKIIFDGKEYDVSGGTHVYIAKDKESRL